MDSIKIFVDCNKKDYYSYYLSKITTGLFKKISLVLLLLFLILLIVAAITVIGFYTLTIESKLFIAFTNVFFLLIVFLFISFNYIIRKYFYLKNSLSKSLWSIEESKIDISNNMTHHTLLWNDIRKISEYKSCFVFHISPVVYYIIPMRCFNSQEQLDAFINLINHRVQKKELRNYDLKNVTIVPKAEATSSFDIVEKKEEGRCILELNFELSRIEYLKFIFKIFYSKPIGIILTTLGVLALYRYFQLIEYNIVFLLIFGVTFTIFFPAFILILVQIMPEKRLQLQYKYYEDYILSAGSSYMFRIKWADLAKFKETKTCFQLNSNIYAITIPKRVFENQPDKLQKFRSLIMEHIKN
ncbi:MAG: YcxB family protein [Acetivibrionales bacterium]